MTIRSEEFDDIYFSPEDGVAETEYVFLRGNNLPQNWLNKDHFTIAETGFGTGLNFFVAWDMFEQAASPQQSLHFVSFHLAFRFSLLFILIPCCNSVNWTV